MLAALAVSDAGPISADAAVKSRSVAKAELYDIEKIGKDVESGRYILMPFIRVLIRRNYHVQIPAG